MFLISLCGGHCVLPFSWKRIETFTSKRPAPSSRRISETPEKIRMSRSARTYASPSSAELMSGSLTISSSGTRARQAEANGTDERVRRRAEPSSLAPAEHLRVGLELDVGLDADDELVRRSAHGHSPGGTTDGVGGAELRSSGTIKRSRLTMTRSAVTETRYRSRPRSAPSLGLPRASNVKRCPPVCSHDAM